MRKIVKVEELEMVGAGATTAEWVNHNPGKPYQDLGFSSVQNGPNETYKVAHSLNVMEWHENYQGQRVFGWHIIDIYPINYYLA